MELEASSTTIQACVELGHELNNSVSQFLHPKKRTICSHRVLVKGKGNYICKGLSIVPETI